MWEWKGQAVAYNYKNVPIFSKNKIFKQLCDSVLTIFYFRLTEDSGKSTIGFKNVIMLLMWK